MLRRALLFLCLLMLLPLGAFADELGRTKIGLKNQQNDNFVLFADEVDHIDQNDTTVARGHVQIVSEPYVLTADEVTYSADQDLMTAKGHVRLIQQQQALTPIQLAAQAACHSNCQPVYPIGTPTEILSTDYMEMSGQGTVGKLMNVKVLFADNSRLVGRDGTRYTTPKNTEQMELTDVVYSPCALCKNDPEHPPLWQVDADRFVHDDAEQEMRYYDATMKFEGVPFFYTPYFSHGDPSSQQTEGFLNPQYYSSSYLGSFLRNYYYYPISPTQDLTMELSEATAQGPLLGFEYRKQFDNANIKLTGAATNSELETQTGNREADRGYLGVDALWDIDSMWRAGADIKYSGDQSFLQEYKFDNSDVLTDRVYAERFNGRSYASVNAYAFQDLNIDEIGTQPDLLPLITYSDYGTPGGTLGGRWGINTSFIGVTRPSGGQSVQRLSGGLNWQRQWISDLGVKSILSLSSHGDSYQVQDGSSATAGPNTGQAYGINRGYLDANWQSSVPFVKSGQYLQYEIEPIAALGATSSVKNSEVPDEDSQELELDASNLFDPSRYPGLDRVEDGERFTYGARGSITNRNGGYYSIFAGQSDRISGSNNMPVGSGLTKDLSDIVGEINAIPSKYLDADYHIRVDNDTLSVQRHEASLSAGPEWLRWSTSYAYIRVLPTESFDSTVPPAHSEITNSILAKLTDKWSLFVQDQKDLDNKPTSLITETGLKYLDECFTITFSYERNYTERIGLDSGDSFYVAVGFKNLGTYGSTAYSSLSAIPTLTVPNTTSYVTQLDPGYKPDAPSVYSILKP